MLSSGYIYIFAGSNPRKFMIRERELKDEQLGTMMIKIHPKARHIILRTRTDGVHITVPTGTNKKEIIAIIEKYRERLLTDKQKTKRKRIDLDYKIDSEFFKLSLIRGTLPQFLARSEQGRLQIVCPHNADFEDEKLQIWLLKVIEEAVRRNARVILPTRLKLLSEKTGLPFGQVRVNSSKSRWGSCSARKHINLSYYLLLLPSHLMDYVLLHELAHTREMNHGERFWALLNELTEGKALSLRKELKQYKTEI